MTFQFSLQRIVDLKIRQKSLAEWHLSKALGQLAAGEVALEELEREKKRVQQRMSKQLDKISVLQLQQLEYYLFALNKRIEQKRQEINEAQSQVFQKKDALKGKMIDEKVWTQARERARVLYRTEELRKEQNTLDDLATSRFKDS